MPPAQRPDPPVAVNQGAPCRTSTFDTAAGSKLVVGSALILMGFSIVNESTTAEAEVDLFDGVDAESTPTFPITLLPQESVRDWFGDRGINMLVGLFASAAIGGVKGSVFWYPAPGT